MHPILSLLLGLLCAGIGGEMFVKGAVGLAHWARIPAAVIGVTVAAFATSSPELSVSISAALAGQPNLALGDALGSNVVNVGLIMALALFFGPVSASGAAVKRDLPAAMVAPVFTGILILDGVLSRIDAVLLLIVFGSWLGLTIRQAIQERSEPVDEVKRAQSLGFALAGLGLLILSGTLIVSGAKFIGQLWGMDPFVVGATLVAVGTSMPELATVLVSRLRGHDEIGLGAILGSNLFNGLFIVGIAGLIHPIQVRPDEVLIGLIFGVLTLLAVWPRAEVVPAKRAWVGLGIYAAYTITLIQVGQR